MKNPKKPVSTFSRIFKCVYECGYYKTWSYVCFCESAYIRYIYDMCRPSGDPTRVPDRYRDVPGNFWSFGVPPDSLTLISRSNLWSKDGPLRSFPSETPVSVTKPLSHTYARKISTIFVLKCSKKIVPAAGWIANINCLLSSPQNNVNDYLNYYLYQSFHVHTNSPFSIRLQSERFVCKYAMLQHNVMILVTQWPCCLLQALIDNYCSLQHWCPNLISS